MNRINHQTTADIRLKKWLASIDEKIKGATINETEVTRIVKKVLATHKSGVSKEELLLHLEAGLKKSSSKEVIIEAVIELFGGKENFGLNGYKGGWNPTKDLKNIKETFGGESNFANDKYTGGWNKTQDSQNLKQSLENGEAKTLTSQIVEEKLGGSDKFQAGIFQAKSEIVKSVLEELQAKGEILKEVQNIFGSEKFYPNQSGEGVPQGREGFYKKDEEIALLQAEANAKIKAIEAWRDFYQEHGITETSDKTFWSNKYSSDVKTAEGVYKDALLKGEEIVGGDFTKLEENRINKAPTPEKIQAILKDIPVVRRKKAWENFFANHDTLGNIKPDWKDNWTKSNLSVEVAKLIYNNGWYNSPNGLINNDKIIESYTTDILVMGQKHPQTTKLIETLKHSAKEIDKVHEFIAKRIETEKDLDKFPSNDEIEKKYSQELVPDTRSWGEIGKIRDKTIKELFKQYFQEKQPATNLKYNEIELWRTSPTGLSNTGKDQRIAYDNGWINPVEIKNSQISYQNIENIEVLKVNKQVIDAEIQKVNNLVKQINSYQYLRDLDTNQANIDKQFSDLKTELLPPQKEQEITEAVKKQRNNLYYSLTDPKDGGLEKTTLERLVTAVDDDWKVPNYEPISVAMLNNFIAADKDVQSLGLLQDGQEGKWEDLTESGWLKGQGGYELPKDKTNAEDKLHRDQKGTYLLKIFYDKARDGKNYPFDPDKLDKAISFCRIGEDEVTRLEGGGRFSKAKEVKVRTPVIGGDKGTAGHLAIGTGVGKTTKLINCLVQGGNRHIILVCPTVGLVDSAVGHHTSWLQKWGCVYHGGAKGKTEMEFCLKGTFTKATDEDISSGKEVEKEKKNIYISHGSYPVAKNDLAYWYNANTNQKEGKEPGKKGLSVMYFGNLLGFAARNLFVESKGIDGWSDQNEKQKVKEKLIPKEDTIVVFDEAHFNDAGYQALQFEMINAGYDCLRMSATFPKTEFSTTSTYPMKRMFSGKLDPKMPAGLMKIDNAEQAEIIETMRGVEVGSIKFQDEKGLPIPIEVNLEERIQAGKTWYFSKGLQLNDDQIKALGSNVKYTIYSEQYDENCEDVSFGQPYGSLGIVDGRREMGYTPDIDTVICSGVTETTNLGKYFTYSDPVLGFTPISSLVQQMGRSARIKWGLSISLTKKCMEMDISDNVSAAMVKAAFDGNTKQIEEKAYQQIYDVDILRGALAYPSPKTFGKAPEEILMGLRITEKQQSKKEKISKLDWRQNNDTDEAEALDKPWFAKGLAGKVLGQGINPSKDLWDRYLGKAEKVVMDEDVALNTLKEMISNFITQDNSFPQGLNLKKQEKMIGTVFGKKLDLSGGKKEVVHETRTVLNGLVGGKVNELSTKDYDDTKKQSKNPNTIKKLAGLYKLADAQIDYQRLANPEGKEVWTLLMQT